MINDPIKHFCRALTRFTIVIACTIASVFGLPLRAYASSGTWLLNPIDGDWNTAANWSSNSVPNGALDVATFGTSDLTNLSINTTAVELSNIVFNSGAPPFTITVDQTNLSITGSGIVNNSGVVQSVIQIPNGAIFFTNATAGEMTSFSGTFFVFYGSSSAATASLVVNSVGIYQGSLDFWDTSTAAGATITISNFAFASFNDSATAANAVLTVNTGGFISFGANSTADDAVTTCSGAPGTIGSGIVFSQFATAAQGHFTALGAVTSSDAGSYIDFSDTTTAASATFVINGGAAQDAAGAVMTFFDNSTAANATLTANGGVNGGDGGAILFVGRSLGGTASISLFGNGELDIGNRASPGVTIGSLAGNGLVFLGPRVLSTGSNNQSTTFSGVIQDGGMNQGTGGSLTKLGTGTLTLSGANTYTGTTTVSGGALKAGNKSGSATGIGAVNVNTGTLGGKGIMRGATTIGTGSGTGSFLAPSVGANQPTTLTIQSALTIKADGTYTYKLNTKKAKADKVIANGVTIESGAQFSFKQLANKKLTAGTVFTAISNTAATPISGAFANLSDGSTFTAGRNNYQVSYSGGDGNDLTLTVVP